jgi:MFS family permease
MNWVMSKKYRIIIIISVALLLCGFPMILLSQTLEGFPNNILSHLGIFMSMGGGGGIGAVISMQIMSRRSKNKCNMKRYNYTNRLKKKAWIDFCVVCVSAIVGPLCYGFMTYADIKGLQGATYFLGGLAAVGLGVGFLIFLNSGKQQKNTNLGFDEREFHLLHKAINISNITFICYTLLVVTTAFYIIGGRGTVPMWSIPLALFSGIFVAGTVQFLFLMHYAKEDNE